MNTTQKPSALLLMGPTGSGKSPLGDLMAHEGLEDTTCFHFDFGEALRKAAAREDVYSRLEDRDICFIQRVLNEGALLENQTFYIAENILGAFMATHRIKTDDLLVLNGLPRHIDQARDMTRQVEIRQVVHLECMSETVIERIRLNTGGDRSNRVDDSLDDIRAKLATFTARTLPLIDFFRHRGAVVHTLPVGVTTTARSLLNHIRKKAAF